jgi:hypothetical protein
MWSGWCRCPLEWLRELGDLSAAIKLYLNVVWWNFGGALNRGSGMLHSRQEKIWKVRFDKNVTFSFSISDLQALLTFTLIPNLIL